MTSDRSNRLFVAAIVYRDLTLVFSKFSQCACYASPPFRFAPLPIREYLSKSVKIIKTNTHASTSQNKTNSTQPVKVKEQYSIGPQTPVSVTMVKPELRNTAVGVFTKIIVKNPL